MILNPCLTTKSRAKPAPLPIRSAAALALNSGYSPRMSVLRVSSLRILVLNSPCPSLSVFSEYSVVNPPVSSPVVSPLFINKSRLQSIRLSLPAEIKWFHDEKQNRSDEPQLPASDPPREPGTPTQTCPGSDFLASATPDKNRVSAFPISAFPARVCPVIDSLPTRRPNMHKPRRRGVLSPSHQRKLAKISGLKAPPLPFTSSD